MLRMARRVPEPDELQEQLALAVALARETASREFPGLPSTPGARMDGGKTRFISHSNELSDIQLRHRARDPEQGPGFGLGRVSPQANSRPLLQQVRSRCRA